MSVRRERQVFAPSDDRRGLPEAAGRHVFSAAGRDYCWSDVIAAARFRGDWAELERKGSARGSESARGSAEDGVGVEQWRRRRGLLSADETVAWLARWGLGMADVWRYVGSELASGPVDLDRAAWGEAVCSGALDRFAWALAGPVALASDPPAAGSPLDATVFARLEAEFERCRAEIESSEAVARLIEGHAAEWTTVVARTLTLPGLHPAREAVLCVRWDGMSLAEVAGLSGGELGEVRCLLDELEEPARGSLASAAPGELLGPLPAQHGYRVLEVLARVPPTSADPVVLARGRELAVRRAIVRAAAVRIVWHDRL